MQSIIRSSYLDQIHTLINKHTIILLVGLRRVGKSTIMQQFMKQEQIKDATILYLPLEQFDFLHLRKKDDLIQYLRSRHIETIQYLCIDEIQLISGREEVINGIHASFPAINIILTGSNSDLLSTEIATGLRGRVYQIYVYPFDIHEYCKFHRTSPDHSNLLSLLQTTGLPLVYRFDDPAYMIQELVNTVFLKDIVERYTIKDVDLLRSIFAFLVSNGGNITNLAKIAEYLTQIGFTINLNTIGNYVTYLKNSLLVHECPLYDIQGKRVFDKLRKFYLADHGLRNYLFSRYDLGTGKQLENYIYLQLLKHHYHVYVGRIDDKEIDFIAEKNGKKIYIQIAWALDSPEVYEREFGNLLTIKDNRPKYVISMDQYNAGSQENVSHIQAWEIAKIL